MENIFYSSTTYLIGLVESILETNIHVHGEENLLHESPTLFVANHFTRFETFVMPYIISSHSQMGVRSLADHSIFVGYFGGFLNKLGTLSTQHLHRNEIILGDLMTGRKNWIIYPEGAMVKNKKIIRDDGFVLDFLDGKESMHTGSAVLAMESELLKQEYKEAQHAGDIIKVRKMREKYFIKPDERVAYKNTVVMPINITYVPVRPGMNPFMSIGSKFVDTIDERIKEELEIEGNILLNSEIHIHFDKPINISEYLYQVKGQRREACAITGGKELIGACRHDLTTQFMTAVYKNVLINFDHIFALALEYYAQDRIDSNELKRAIFLAARDVALLGKFNLHHSITEELFKLLTDECDPWYDSSLSLALDQKVLSQVEEGLYNINRKIFSDEHTFHTIRIKNTLRVILNEMALFPEVSKSVQDNLCSLKDNLCKSSQRIKEEVFKVIYDQDYKNYVKSYNRFYSVYLSKPKETGRPFVLYNPVYSVGVVLSHGYKSSPSEVKELAHYLHRQGINVYAVRLEGHGTVREDLRDRTWEEWYDSFNRGFAAMRQVSRKIYLVGFSTGGLLAMLATARKSNKIDGLVVINAAMELQDIRVKYLVPSFNKMNDFLSIFHADLEYVDTEPEFPEYNYKRNYIKSLEQLRLLMEECRFILPTITTPTLILQADKDPVVKPESADRILEKINSADKSLEMFDFSRHVITAGKGNKKVFKAVADFINRLLKEKKI